MKTVSKLVRKWQPMQLPPAGRPSAPPAAPAANASSEAAGAHVFSLDDLARHALPIEDFAYTDSEPPAEFGAILASREPSDRLAEVLRVFEDVGSGEPELWKPVTERQAEELWRLYDADRSGRLEREEVCNLVKDLANAHYKRLSEQINQLSVAVASTSEADSLFEALDTSGDGKVQKEEFIALAQSGIHNLPVCEDAGIPPKRARSQDGVPVHRDSSTGSKASLAGIFALSARSRKGLQRLSSGITADEAEQLWAEIDVDGDGYLDEEKVRNLFCAQVDAVLSNLYGRLRDILKCIADTAVADRLITDLDRNKDGIIEKHEFVECAMSGGMHIMLPD
mmetsp:Transcript_36859/g.89817  ORF Transcript_36859/g.89817 Transcript_36859/m.89817 type:complete len:338 (-) Transcript_36859:1190-2203(-)